MKSIKIFLLCAVLCAESLLCGCWSYMDIENYALVSGFSIDRNEKGDKYALTIEVVDFQMAGKEAKQVSSYLETEGTTIFDAIRNAINLVGKKLYWAHTNMLIINETIAKEGITSILDFINRDPEVREQMYILISKEKTAREVLKQQALLAQASSVNIENMLRGQTQLGKSPAVEAYRLVSLLGEGGFSFTLPAISMEKVAGKQTAVLSGTAVFKSDKLVGYLDPEETKYYLFAIDKIHKGYLTLKEEASSKTDDITLEIFKTKTNVRPEYSKNKLKINMNIKTQVTIAEIGTNVDYISEKNRGKLKNDADKLLKESVEKIIKKVQHDFDADIFGFGMKVNADLPSAWKTLEHDWDKQFKELEFNVNTDIRIKNSGLISNILQKGD